MIGKTRELQKDANMAHEGLFPRPGFRTTPEGPTHVNCQCKASSLPKRRTLVVVSRMISLCRSSTTIFTWPSFEARCKPFSPFCEEQRGREGVVSGTVHPVCPAVPSGWNGAPSLRRVEGESWRGPEWYQLRHTQGRSSLCEQLFCKSIR